MPPKKGKKMALDEFLMDAETGGSWADEMDSLPTGPSGDFSRQGELGGSHLSRNSRGGGDRMDRGGGFGAGRDGEDRPPRAEVPIPTAPPYTAFVGNLAFDTTEGDLDGFFAPLQTTSVRLVSGYDLKPKGFGYVEFGSVADLKTALALTGNDMAGRAVRISVAEPPKSREGRADDEVSWVRSGPLAPLPGRSGGGFGGGDRSGGGGFDRNAPRERDAGGFGGEDKERDGPIRGGKFVPSAGGSEHRRPGGFDRSASSSGGGAAGGERSYERAPVVAEEKERDGPIRGGKFVASAPAPSSGGFERRAVSGSASAGGASEERSWARQGPLPPLQGRSASGGFGSGPRSFGDRTPPSESPAAPQRQRLQLSARSTSSTPAASPASSDPSTPAALPASSKPSPFGAAKPVDVLAREKEIEAKLAKEKLATKEKLDKERAEKREEKEESLQKEQDRDDKIAKARFGGGEAKKEEPESKKVDEVVSPTPKPVAALRKEGFSYSSIANAKTEEQKGDAEVAQKVAEVTI